MTSHIMSKKKLKKKMSINFFEKIEKNNNKYIYKNLFNDEEISEDKLNKFKNDIVDDNKKIKDDEVSNDKINNQNKIIDNKQNTNESEIRNEIKENTITKILKELTEEKNKNKKLENELKEKNKTIENLEKEVKHLKNELDKQIKINKDC